MLAAGVTRDEILTRTRSGGLIRVHRGVYRVGHAAWSPEAMYMAAVRACGDSGVLSGLAAAWLHRLLKGQPRPPEVTTRTERRVPGVITHRSRKPIRRTEVRGIP